MTETIIQGFRLSPQQRHLYLLQEAGRSLPFRAQCAILLEGPVNVESLKAAIQRVVNRHEILRTTFCNMPGMKVPLQVISDDSLLSIEEYDLSHLGDKAQEDRIESLFQEFGREPFNFKLGPLLKLSLAALSPHKYVLLVSLPAVCADMATLKNLVAEIGQCYELASQSEGSSGEPIQYVDFCEWQNDLLGGDDAQIGRAYWRKRDLSSAFELALPFQQQSSEADEFDPQIIRLTVHQGLSAQIEAAARLHETSARVFLLGCWMLLLCRQSERSEIVVGAAFDGRRYKQLEKALGLFARCLPIHYKAEASCRFGEMLRQLDEAAQSAYKWQEYFNYEEVERIDQPGISSPPFFPCSFECEELPSAWRVEELIFSLYKQYVCFDRFKLKLSCFMTEHSTITEFHYDARAFASGYVQRLAAQYHALLASASQSLESAADALSLLGETERHQLLVEFNDTRAANHEGECIHHLFEAQAARTPDRVAVAFEGQHISYAQLNERANLLAHHLIGLGVGPESPVALCVDRSLDMIIGMLGIIKAGGAYLPLDPAQPVERLAFMVAETHADVLLTQQRLTEGLGRVETRVVCLDAHWPVIAGERNDNPRSGAGPKNLVYVLFTSGSTGRPKGVAVEHQQLSNYVSAIQDRLNLSECRSFATLATFAADLGNTAIFPSLCGGGCLHIVSQETAVDATALGDYFHLNAIDCLKIVPGHLNALLASGRKVLPRLRLVLGGEASRWELIKRVQELAPGCAIFNHYGPTEATVGMLTYGVKQDEANNCSVTVPLGRPILNSQVYLLDRHFQSVPIGVGGEIHIGGAGLARGYYNRPELSAERFIPNPFAQEPGARLYKTGDLTRYIPDGCIEFLGRVDNQVKIRGFRIELAEIETTLRQHTSVRDVVAVAREMADRQGEKQLVAYVVSAQGQVVTVNELRNYAKAKLPEPMIPSAFVLLEALPLTPNGKVDRQMLPEPEQGKNFVAPRNPAEEVLAEIWAELLRVDRVGAYDNFFELGGDSLIAIQITARIWKIFQLELVPRTVFETPTVASLADLLVRQEAQPGRVATTARLHKKINKLSTDEIEMILQAKRRTSAD